MKIDLSRHAPPGINLEAEKALFFWGNLLSCSGALVFFRRYDHHLQFIAKTSDLTEIFPGAIMEDFVVLIDRCFVGFAIVALCMVFLTGYHYWYHWQDSRSIYLMRRLPKRWELHRRCVVLPLIAIILSACIAFILLLLLYAFYMNRTPAQCIAPGQWQKIWSV